MAYSLLFRPSVNTEHYLNNFKYIVMAASSQKSLEQNGCDVEFGFDTLKEAKERAKYYLTEDYRKPSESEYRLGYSQVKKTSTGEIVADYFNHIGVYVPEGEA